MVDTAKNVNIFWISSLKLQSCMIVQIYEIQTPSEAETMIQLGVDHIGSVLLDRSAETDPGLKRTVETVQSAGRKSSLIPLFKDVEAISAAVNDYRPDILHLCESLPSGKKGQQEVAQAADRQKRLRERFPDIDIMRSIPIARQGRADENVTLRLASLFEPISDWFLTDTILLSDGNSSPIDQPVQGFVGITGETCDWSVANALVRQSGIPVVLAGGLGPLNVASGIRAVNPAGVDSCTLTNAVDSNNKPIRFQKDPQKVKMMVAAARNNGATSHNP